MAAGQCSRCGVARTDGWAFCRACGAVGVPAPRAAGDDEAADRAGEAVPAGRGTTTASVPGAAGPKGVRRAAPGSGAHGTSGRAPVAGTGPAPPPPTRVRVHLREDPPRRSIPAAGPARLAGTLTGTARDWLAALTAAAATLAVLAVPGALLAVVAGTESPAVSPLVLLPVAIALGVGGSVSVQLDLGTLGGLDSVVAGTPLLVTAVAVATGASLVIADTRPAPQMPAQAARTVVLFLAGLTAIALAGRAATTGGTITVAVLPTLLGGALWFTGALVLVAAWRRPDVLSPACRRVRDLLAGPAAGVGAVLGSCWLGGLALLVSGVLARAAGGTPVQPTRWVPAGVSDAATASGPSTAGVLAVVAVAVLAPTAVLGAFAFCLGIPVTGRGPTGENTVGLVHLLGQGPSWWLAPLVGAVVCVLGGMVAALHASSAEEALRRGWALGPALAVALALVTVVTSLSAGPLGLGLDVLPAVVLGLGWGALGGLLGAVVAPGLPAALRRGRLGDSATGQVVGVLVVVGFLGAALVIGLAAAARAG
ncbi:zinc ribbon domain-containing protein [Actinomycetospora endophytica]|uniref:Zinc ribbon domain-containing protein n=1 Tax=Actinomycetospora endophytica TaxID=2291215 RepID=A0ABS8PCQ2_9PSEU|nr:zinc ribbon domain-containing protein [Actinomycetospora endophytica]MCD2196060.1 zinc ribbon domain-containing protein [Actinomycetospora endophytica]